MDHYSLDTLGKLHRQELMQEGLRGQAVRRSFPRVSRPTWKKRGILVAVAAIAVMFFRLFV